MLPGLLGGYEVCHMYLSHSVRIKSDQAWDSRFVVDLPDDANYQGHSAGV
jgi:hypothetical protein